MAEKTLNQIPRSLREQYDKGMTALQRKNFDYAIAIFGAVLEQDPAFFDCRQALRASQFQKTSGGSSFFKKMLSGASSSPLLAKGQLALRMNALDALKIAEQILSSDPNSAAGHKLLADAADHCRITQDGGHVAGNSGEEFAQGQGGAKEFGSLLCQYGPGRKGGKDF